MGSELIIENKDVLLPLLAECFVWFGGFRNEASHQELELELCPWACPTCVMFVPR